MLEHEKPNDEQRTKRCCHCKLAKALKDFYRLRSAPDGRYPNCIKCYREQRVLHKSTILAGRRRWERAIREEVIRHYGGRCTCCDETTYEFLAISPIKGASTQRKIVRTPLPYWLKKNGFPSGFCVRCHNCNTALQRNGYCPHEREFEPAI